MATLTHAGAIVFRDTAAGRRYLVVQARRNAAHWVLPKGHLEAGERPEETAVREAREEAGVAGEVVEEVGTSTFRGPRGPVVALYFLLRYEAAVTPAEKRGMAWLSCEAARARLSFEDDRRLLTLAHERQLPGGPPPASGRPG